ncbi:MAG: BrnT family toxin [Candidatus Omnitrophica bacterium]|nr:BrnT family toxin [Candidatus Omnitrophota bacterium]
MTIQQFEWNEWNIEHIDRHNVTPQEVEEACFNQSVCRKTREGLFLIYGQTDSGRYLLTVIRLKNRSTAYTITSRPMTEKEKHFYRQEK